MKEGVWPGQNKIIKIGILEGIGPEATNYFYSKLINKIQKENYFESNEDFPQIIINSIPAPELTNNIIKKEELIYYKKGIMELDSMNLDFIIICCNTIHLYFGQITRGTNTLIINLKDELKKCLMDLENEKIGIIGTPKTTKKLYNFKKIKKIKPNKKENEIITKSINNYNSGKEKKIQKNNILKIINKFFENKNTKKVLLGCTELEVMFSNNNFPKIEPLEILANTTIKKIRSLKKLKDVNI
jgi:aspartate racemase